MKKITRLPITKLWLIAILLISISSVTTLIIKSLLFNKNDTTESNSTPSVVPEKIGIAAVGRLEPAGEVINLAVPPDREGAKVQELLVKVGDRVESGAIVAILDNRDRLATALKHKQTLVGIAQANLDKVKAGAKQGAIEAQKAKIRRLAADLTGQKETFDKTILKIQAELDNATRECQRYRSLYQNGAISASEQDNLCLKQLTLTEELAATTANRSRVLTTLEEEYQEGKATLTEIVEIRDVDVAIAAAELAEAEAGVKQAEADLDWAYLKAPKQGQILKIYTFPGEVVSDEGVVAIGDTSQMYVVAEVYETDISRVKLGQKATVTSIGFVGTLEGVVTEIGLKIGKKDVLNTDPAADVDSRVVEVKIRLDELSTQKVASLTNLQVNVVISPNL